MDYVIVARRTVEDNTRDCTVCERCGTVLDINSQLEDGRTERFNFTHDAAHPTWYRVTYSHNDWGPDSVESFRTMDFCKDCIAAYLMSFLGDPSTTKNLEIETHEGHVPMGMIQEVIERHKIPQREVKKLSAEEILGTVLPYAKKDNGIFAAAKALFDKTT